MVDGRAPRAERRPGRAHGVATTRLPVSLPPCLTPGQRPRVRPRRPERPHLYRATTTGCERYSAFESAKQAADTRFRRDLVYGDDSRAWDDINLLDAAGVGRRHVRRPELLLALPSGLQLDGRRVRGSMAPPHWRSRGSWRATASMPYSSPRGSGSPGGARHPLADRSPVGALGRRAGSPGASRLSARLQRDLTVRPLRRRIHPLGDGAAWARSSGRRCSRRRRPFDSKEDRP